MVQRPRDEQRPAMAGQQGDSSQAQGLLRTEEDHHDVGQVASPSPARAPKNQGPRMDAPQNPVNRKRIATFLVQKLYNKTAKKVCQQEEI